MRQHRCTTASIVAFCLLTVLLPVTSVSAEEVGRPGGPTIPFAAEERKDSFLRWSGEGQVSLVPGAELPGKMSAQQAQMGLDSLNKHLAAGHVSVSPQFDVRVTPAGREAAVLETAAMFGECRRVTDVRASWLGIFVDGEDLCDSKSPNSVGDQHGGKPAGGDVTIASHDVEWFNCGLTVFGAALSIWAFLKQEEWSDGYWVSIAAVAVTIYLAARSCYSVWGVWIEKHDGWGQTSDYYHNWRYSGAYGWLPGGQDSYTSNSFWWCC